MSKGGIKFPVCINNSVVSISIVDWIPARDSYALGRFPCISISRPNELHLKEPQKAMIGNISKMLEARAAAEIGVQYGTERAALCAPFT